MIAPARPRWYLDWSRDPATRLWSAKCPYCKEILTFSLGSGRIHAALEHRDACRG